MLSFEGNPLIQRHEILSQNCGFGGGGSHSIDFVILACIILIEQQKHRLDTQTDTYDMAIDVKNINLQIEKTLKTCFFHFYKKHVKHTLKTLNYI